jgi:tripartite-type tricarboxylate transporter receptor subunit TctC
VNSLPEFIAYVKANQSKMQYGSAGTGSATHTSCVLLTDKIGVKVTHVPYRGAGPALQDLMAGRIDFMCDVVSTSLPQIRAGTVRAIAMLSNTRAKVLPNLATARELGLADVDADGWNAFFFPKGTPAAIVRKFNAATSAALETAAVRERIEGLGLFVPKPEERGPEFLAKLVLSELDKWGPPIKAAGVSID